MSFSSPLWLLALLAVPLALLAYLEARRRGRRYAIRFPAASTLLAAAGAVPAWRRHLPAALALAAMASLAVALARPHRTVRVPVEQASVVLVTDHSGSMQATDVDPNRLSAAQKAAERFIDAVPKGTRVGAVAFSDRADMVQAPTTDHDATRRVIDGQVASGATATGDALQTALNLVRGGGKKDPAAIILLSDGARTTGRDPLGVADEARRARVPIYTVALGTADATVPNPNPFGPPLSAAPDPETLRRVADISGARAFAAGDRDKLNSIYQRLGSRLASRSKQREITAAFAVGGLLLLLGAGVTSLRSAGRLP
jgi:Ca-activated chloride channel family protein